VKLKVSVAYGLLTNVLPKRRAPTPGKRSETAFLFATQECACAKGFLHNVGRRFSPQEDDYRFLDQTPNFSSDFDFV
jgi:hypothetical protein